MITNSRFIVKFKRDKKSRTLYYGPFVSERIADRFADDLPDPEEGGGKITVPLQQPVHA